MKPDQIPNRPTEIGKEMGSHLADLTERATVEQQKQFPNMKLPCRTCAFRRGSIPNGCEPTVMDALKCVLEGNQFLCHETINKVTGECESMCAGWLIAYSATKDTPPIAAPWGYSHEEEKL